MTKPKASDIHTEMIRAALLAIAARNNDILNPADIVATASDPSSPLHDEFEWDDDAAADAYRLIQAAALIRRVRITIIRSDPKTRVVSVDVTRAYQSRPSMRNAEGGYEPLQSILSDTDKREELLHQVLRELRAYRKRYSDLLALGDIWAAIDSAVDLHIPSAGAKPGDDTRPAAQ